MLAITLTLAVMLSFSAFEDRILWGSIIFAVTFIPEAFYYIYISSKSHHVDIDIKDMKMRAAFFKVQTLSLLFIYIIILYLTESNILQNVLLGAAAINVVFIIVLILFKMELSFHIAMLTLLVLFLTVYKAPYYFILGLIPLCLVGFARYKLKMHTWSELFVGFASSSLIYLLVLVFAA